MPRRAVVLLALLPGAAAAQETPDDRLLGHLPYAEASAADLAPAPPGFALGQPCRVQAMMLPDLTRLLGEAAAAGLGQSLRGLSCFRSVARQQRVFCRSGNACAETVARAASVGPPAHSEHAHGYAIAFAVRSIQSGGKTRSPGDEISRVGTLMVAGSTAASWFARIR